LPTLRYNIELGSFEAGRSSGTVPSLFSVEEPRARATSSMMITAASASAPSPP
jgi:hypothetical protein